MKKIFLIILLFITTFCYSQNTNYNLIGLSKHQIRDFFREQGVADVSVVRHILLGELIYVNFHKYYLKYEMENNICVASHWYYMTGTYYEAYQKLSASFPLRSYSIVTNPNGDTLVESCTFIQNKYIWYLIKDKKDEYQFQIDVYKEN